MAEERGRMDNEPHIVEEAHKKNGYQQKLIETKRRQRKPAGEKERERERDGEQKGPAKNKILRKRRETVISE